MKKLSLTLIFAAVFAVVLHAGHPEHAHASATQHDCSFCQVVTISTAPAAAVIIPHFEATSDVLPKFVVLASSKLSLLPDNRGPPAA